MISSQALARDDEIDDDDDDEVESQVSRLNISNLRHDQEDVGEQTGSRRKRQKKSNTDSARIDGEPVNISDQDPIVLDDEREEEELLVLNDEDEDENRTTKAKKPKRGNPFIDDEAEEGEEEEEMDLDEPLGEDLAESSDESGEEDVNSNELNFNSENEASSDEDDI